MGHVTRWALLLPLLAGCATASQPDPAPAPVARDPRLREDCGGWTPPAVLIDDALREGTATQIDALRAGLRLADDAAARTAAARLTWKQMDAWECARAVELLSSEVLRPGTTADFDEFRSYLGTTDLPAFIDALPPLPWNRDPAQAVSELHRVLHEDSFAAWTKLMRHADAAISDEACTSWWATIADRCTGPREPMQMLTYPAGKSFPAAPVPGLSSALIEEIRRWWLAEKDGKETPPLDRWTRAWCLESTPGPQDEALLLELGERYGADSLWDPGGVAAVLLGRIRGEASDAFLRGETVDNESTFAWAALAMRGEPGAFERLAAWSADDDYDGEEPLAALMAADPARARTLIEGRVFGADERLALLTLGQLQRCVVPGWTSGAMAFDTSRVVWHGFDERARTAPLPALRRAMIGAVVPGCRTRAVAEAACRDLDRDLFETELPMGTVDGHSAKDDVLAFLETAAPSAFRAALRRLAAGDPEVARPALATLLEIGDPLSGGRLLELTTDDPFGHITLLLGRSPSPEVLAWLRERVLADGPRAPWAALATALGAPEEVRWPEKDVPEEVQAALVAGDWRTAVRELLAQQPDTEHGDIGVLGDDPSVRAYLARLRDRRDLGRHWYATGQLAAMGDDEARAELWDVFRTGRYRIVEDQSSFATTLGRDLEATMPFWLDQLRASCCKVVWNGEPWNDLFGVETYEVLWRTPFACAKEIWDAGAATGAPGFAWSRVRGCYVLAAR